MAETSYPFDAGAGATVNEAQWQAMARRFLATGVIDDSLNELAVTADGSAMAVSVATGDAFVEGFFYRNDAAKALTIGTAHATNPRIDTVVVQLDRVGNTAALAVVAGTAAASPVAPTLTQTDSLYELPLADVRVDAAVGVIASGKVTDRRAYTKNLSTTAASAAYLLKTGKAADSELLDGLGSAAFQLLNGRGTADGYAPLDAAGLIPAAHLPAAAAGPTFVRKTVTESVSSSIALQYDDELSFAVGAGETWIFEIVLSVGAGVDATDMRVGMGGPAGSDGMFGIHGLATTATFGGTGHIGDLQAPVKTGTTAFTVNELLLGLTSTSALAVVRGYVTTAATAGTVRLAWAQNVSNASAVEVHAHSHLLAQKVA